jgi:hypothetical protein
MDDAGRLMQAFNTRGAMRSTALRLDILMDLEQLRDGRVLSFLLQVLADPDEPAEVRIHVLKSLRTGRLTADERYSVAAELGELILHGASADLRLQAVLGWASSPISAVFCGRSGLWLWRPGAR